MGVELSCVTIGDGRMAASRADVMVASMAACGLRELGDEVDEDGADHEENSGHFAGNNPACQETDWDGRRSRALLTAQADDRNDADSSLVSI